MSLIFLLSRLPLGIAYLSPLWAPLLATTLRGWVPELPLDVAYHHVLWATSGWLWTSVALLAGTVSVSLATSAVSWLWAGIGLLALLGTPVGRWFAGFERELGAWWLGFELKPVTDPAGASFWWRRLMHRVTSPRRWRRLAYLLLQLPIGAVTFPVLAGLLVVAVGCVAAPLLYLTDAATYRGGNLAYTPFWLLRGQPGPWIAAELALLAVVGVGLLLMTLHLAEQGARAYAPLMRGLLATREQTQHGWEAGARPTHAAEPTPADGSAAARRPQGLRWTRPRGVLAVVAALVTVCLAAGPVALVVNNLDGFDARRDVTERFPVGAAPSVTVLASADNVFLQRGGPGVVVVHQHAWDNPRNFTRFLTRSSAERTLEAGRVKTSARGDALTVTEDHSVGTPQDTQSVWVTVPTGASATVRTGNGDIDVIGLAGDLDLESRDGGVTFTGATVDGPIRVLTLGDDAPISFSGAIRKGDLDFKSARSYLSVDLPVGTNAELQASSTAAPVIVDPTLGRFPRHTTGGPPYQVAGDLGSGAGGRIRLASGNKIEVGRSSPSLLA